MVMRLAVGFTDDYIIKVNNLKVYFTKGNSLFGKKNVTKALDGVTLTIKNREIMGIVGESGSGKTTLGRVTIGLQKPTEGDVYLKVGQEEINVSKAKLKTISKYVQMIYQDPYSSIDPIMRVYDVLAMPLKYRKEREIEKRIEDAMRLVDLPIELLENRVYQLSGGQRQRLSIARAVIVDPKYIVADEPTTMLDASLKGEILKIIKDAREAKGISFMLITHELPIAKIISDRITVMYLGKIVELGKSSDVIKKPLHPYTQGLIDAYPRIDPSLKDKLKEIKIKVDVIRPNKGCVFHPRCPFAMAKCKEEEPQLKEVYQDHYVACWLY
ncbi:ABC transporter ATP-binding protein [Sulfolobus tengchongensis]|uniref:ABC transporter ATP-binding protein n=1 Tax=Sulfolobus tengchongensis TaxID=207809 RepID=A0AAX4L1B3_9CREN